MSAIDDLAAQLARLTGDRMRDISPELRARAEQLPPDLAAQLGVAAATVETAELAPFAPRPFPAPIATLASTAGVRKGSSIRATSA